MSKLPEKEKKAISKRKNVYEFYGKAFRTN